MYVYPQLTHFSIKVHSKFSLLKKRCICKQCGQLSNWFHACLHNQMFQKSDLIQFSLHAILCFCQFLNLFHLNNSLVLSTQVPRYFSCYNSKREFWNIHFRTTKVINNNKSHFYCPFSCVPTNAKLKKIIGKPQNGHRLQKLSWFQ